MENILIPTDFSKCADVAIDFAVHIAKLFSAKLELVHVVEYYPLMYPDYSGMAPVYIGDVTEESKKQLIKLKQKLEKHNDVVITTTICDGEVVQGILNTAKKNRAELIVMGTTGASGLQEKLLGSQTGSVITQSKVPVLAIPEKYKWATPSNILLATNGFEKEPKIFDVLIELTTFFKAKLHIVVFTDEKHDKALTVIENNRQIANYGEIIQKKYGIQPIVSNIYGTGLEESLQSYIEKNKIDMLAMFTHHRNFFQNIFKPSVTKHVSYHTKVPLLAVPVKT